MILLDVPIHVLDYSAEGFNAEIPPGIKPTHIHVDIYDNEND